MTLDCESPPREAPRQWLIDAKKSAPLGSPKPSGALGAAPAHPHGPGGLPPPVRSQRRTLSFRRSGLEALPASSSAMTATW